jgi:hypothetical protein
LQAPGTGHQAGAGVLGLDAVPQPVGAARGARLEAQYLGQLLDVGALGVAFGLVAVGDVLGEVLGQVADAAGRVLGPTQHALGVEAIPEAGDVQRFGLVVDGVEGLVPGGQDLAGRRVEVGARLVVPHRRRAVLEANDGRVGPPDLVVSGGQDPAQLGAGHGGRMARWIWGASRRCGSTAAKYWTS